MIFMSKDDDPKDLKDTLDMWCSTLGAKFNENKTVIIPVGSPEYRKNIIDNRKINLNNELTIDKEIIILKDGKTTR